MPRQNNIHICFEPCLPPARSSRKTSLPIDRLQEKTDSEVTPEELHFFSTVLSSFQIDTTAYRARPLLRRVSACLRKLRVNSIKEALQLVISDARAKELLLDTLLIGSTELYRDKAVFDNFRWNFLPKSLERKKALKVLSIGCSDGAELYTIAALLAEKGALKGSHLRGIDVRDTAITKARSGWFADHSSRFLPEDIQNKYFARDKNGYRATSLIRSSIEWQQENLLDMRPETGWDIILCRNVAIYLTERSTLALWQSAYDMLIPSGLLISGKAERPAGFYRQSPCIYSKGDFDD